MPLTLVPTSVTATAGSHPAPAREPRLTATLRQLERPDAVDVECVGDTPVRIRWRGRWTRIAHARGPERLSGDWWCDRYARDYWRCEEEGGRAELVLFRDRGRDSSGAWYLHGWYD